VSRACEDLDLPVSCGPFSHVFSSSGSIEAMIELDHQAIVDAVRGDEHALTRLLEAAAPDVRRKLQISPRWQGVIDPDDVMQVTYLEAFLRIRTFEPSTSEAFLAWLRRIAENNLRDAIREQERAKRPQIRQQPAASEDSYGTLLDRLGATTSTPSRVAGRHENAEIVKNALKRIPPLYARVIRLCDLEGKSAPEAAAELKRSAGAVRMLLARARERLLNELGSAGAFFTDPV